MLMRHGLLGLGDAVGVVADHLVEHLLGVLSRVDERVDVGARELGDAAEDGLLCHE